MCERCFCASAARKIVISHEACHSQRSHPVGRVAASGALVQVDVDTRGCLANGHPGFNQRKYLRSHRTGVERAGLPPSKVTVENVARLKALAVTQALCEPYCKSNWPTVSITRRQAQQNASHTVTHVVHASRSRVECMFSFPYATGVQTQASGRSHTAGCIPGRSCDQRCAGTAPAANGCPRSVEGFQSCKLSHHPTS